MNHKETTKKLESSVLLLNASFIAFKTLNSANSSPSSALGSISVLNGSLYDKACNVLWVNISKLSRDDFKMLYDASFGVFWKINSIQFQAPFQ